MKNKNQKRNTAKRKLVLSVFVMLFFVFTSQIILMYYKTDYKNISENVNQKQLVEESELSNPENNTTKNIQFGNKLPTNANFQENNADEASRMNNDEFIKIKNTPQENDAKVFQENPIEIVKRSESLPKRFEIPKFGISSNIQYVGLNSAGEMDVPNNNTDVAWFYLGTKPGEVGSAVIAGHLDSKYGKPAVFWNLKNLVKGDAVYIFNSNGERKNFEVMYAERYNTDQAPMEKIFGANDGIYLNLVTCDGVWDKYKINYNKRLVVYAKLVL